MQLLDGSEAALDQPPSYQSPRTSLYPLEGFSPESTPAPSTPGALPDELSRARAYLLARKPVLEEAIAVLKPLFENYVSGEDQKNRFLPPWEMLQWYLKQSMNLFERIGAP